MKVALLILVGWLAPAFVAWLGFVVLLVGQFAWRAWKRRVRR